MKSIQFSSVIFLEETKLFLAAFHDRDEIFEGSRDDSSIAGIYSSYISKELSIADYGTVTRIGTLIIEPGNILTFQTNIFT